MAVDTDQYSEEQQLRMVEAIMFAVRQPLTIAAIEKRLAAGIKAGPLLRNLARQYSSRGVNLVQIGNSWAFRTSPDLAFLLTEERVTRRKLSKAAMETLAVVAYHQPLTRAEIENIRGVSTTRSTLGKLIEIGWVGLGTRRDSPGRPVTYIVTRRFLDHFGLSRLADLPDLEDLRSAGLVQNRPD